RRAALAGAVLAREADGTELAKIAGLNPKSASVALTELVRSGIAERRLDGRGRPLYAMHDRYGDAVLPAAPAARVRATRRRAGRWLARQHHADPRMLARAAHELIAAGDVARALAVLVKAGALSEASGRPDQAVEVLELEVSLRPIDDPRRTAALVRVYDLAVRCGRNQSAGEALMELADRAAATGDPRLDVEVLLRGARQALRDGDVEGAERQAR